MSTIAASPGVAVLRTAATESGGYRSEVTARILRRWLFARLYRFFEGLPRSHQEVDLEVLKRVPTPI